MSAPFIGRRNELQTLNKLFKKNSSSLVVVMGRRRIGKSRLVQEFAKGHKFFQFTGLPPVADMTSQDQMNEFVRQFRAATGFPSIIAEDWSDLFVLLADKIKSGRVVVLLDEISWMGSKDPNFLGKLKNAWDLYFKHNPKLVFILCGSVSSWIDTNILSSTGFLGRVSLTLTVEELSLPECNQFWGHRGLQISAYEKFKILSVTGGIPRCLEEIKPSLSAEENIKDLCFTKGGLLVREFQDIFSDLFSRRSDTYQQIVQTLANGPMDIKAICEILDITQSGFISECLEDLVKSGFLQRDFTWSIATGEGARLSHFRLSDNYLRFYLKYIDRELPTIQSNQYAFRSLGLLPGWDTIMGLQFENLVLNNREYVKECLRIKPDDILSNNPYFQRKTTTRPGCQIDYLIQTRFRDLYVCEIKFSRDQIGKAIMSEMHKKIESLAAPKRFSVRPVLIHVNGVHEDVRESGYFAEIIDFKNLLEDSCD